MIVLLPIIIDHDFTAVCSSHLEDTIRRLSSYPETSVIVYCNHSSVKACAEKAGARIHDLEMTEPCDKGWNALPLGGLRSLLHFRNQIGYRDDIITVMNWKTAPLAKNEIEEALHIFENGYSLALISVTDVMDHPAQVGIPYLVYDLDLISVMDVPVNKKETISGIQTSRPKIRYILIRDHSCGLTSLYLREDLILQNATLQCWPVVDDNAYEDGYVEFDMPSVGKNEALDDGAAEGHMFIRIDTTGFELKFADEWILAVVGPAWGHSADFFVPYTYSNLWEVDPYTNERINSHSGKIIRGRQELPPVYEVDGRVCMIRKHDIERLQHLHGNLISNDKEIVTGFPFSGFSAIDSFEEEIMAKKTRTSPTLNESAFTDGEFHQFILKDIGGIASGGHLHGEMSTRDARIFINEKRDLCQQKLDDAIHKKSILEGLLGGILNETKAKRMVRRTLLDMARRMRHSVLFCIENLTEVEAGIHRDFLDFLIQKGETLFKSGHCHEALDCWQNVLTVEPWNERIHQNLADMRREIIVKCVPRAILSQ